MKKWHKLIAALAVVGFFGVLTQTTPASADSSEATSSSEVVSSESSNKVSGSDATTGDSHSDSGITYGSAKAVKAGEENIWHSVFTPGNSATDMKDLTFSDPLDTRLEYVSAKVLQVTKTDSNGDPAEFGADITSQGTLNYAKATNTVSWTPKKPSDFAYSPTNKNSTIDLIVKTKVNKDTKDGSIPNTAVMTLGGQTYKTNDPNLTVKSPLPSKLNKLIGKLAKTGVKLAQAHPWMAALLGILMTLGFGTWGYRVWKKN